MNRTFLSLAALLFCLMLLAPSCKKNICEACTWSGIDTNGDPVSETLKSCTAPGREINRERCNEQASNYVDGQCVCVEE